MTGGVSTGRVRVGRYTLDVGEPAGTTVTLVQGAPSKPPRSLVEALAQPGPAPPAEPVEALEEAVEDAEEVTSKIERAVELFTMVAQGRLDAEAVSKELEALLGLLRRLDRTGRFEDALRLARPLQGLLALTLRWTSLVEALRVALHAAEALANVDAQAWVKHELGSLGLAAEDARGAEGRLEEARALRERSGDAAGLRATEHNLTTLRAAFGTGPSWSARTLAIAGATVLALVVLGFVLVPALDDGSNTDTTSATTTSAPPPPPPPPPPPVGDRTAPIVTITSPQGGVIRSSQVTITGAAGNARGDGRSVRLTVHEGSSNGPAVEGPVDVRREATTWSRVVTLPLEPGTRMRYTAVATQRDAAGNESQPASVTFTAYVPPVDPPPPPTIPDPPPTVTDPPPPPVIE